MEMMSRNERVMWRLSGLCEELARIDPDVMGETANRVRTDLGARMRIAVVGRVKAGKSTLVNALVGRRVAATDDAECTSIVTNYTFGAPERAELVLERGERVPVPFDNQLPSDLPVPAERVAHATVYLQEATLHEFDLIDTPGLATSTASSEQAARRTIVGADAALAADALLYVFRDVQRADDVAILSEFQEASGGRTGASARSLGVLSHADEMGAGTWGPDDPIGIAATHAADLAKSRAADLGTVVPVAGRMAEAARTGTIRERDARLLAALADAPDSVLRDGDGELPAGVEWDDLDALAARIGEYGLRHARQPAASGANAVNSWLTDASGIAGLRAAIADRYARRSWSLTALQRIRVLEDASYRSEQRAELRAAIERARGSDELHPLEELRVWEVAVSRSRTSEAVRELERVIDARTSDEVVGLDAGAEPPQRLARSRELADNAQGQSLLANRRIEREVYRTLARSYALAEVG